MNKLLSSVALFNAATALESKKESGSLLDLVITDDDEETYWIMAPRPGYDVPFDLRSDELVILTADAPDTDAAIAGVIEAQFWNIGGDKFNTETCEMTLNDADFDTYWDSFTITEDEVECATYGGQTGLIQYILSTDTYTSMQFDETGEEWQLATYEEMYNTVDNGGIFPGDEEAKTTWNFFQGAGHLALSAGTIATSLIIIA